jgi:hypothetical protein
LARKLLAIRPGTSGVALFDRFRGRITVSNLQSFTWDDAVSLQSFTTNHE